MLTGSRTSSSTVRTLASGRPSRSASSPSVGARRSSLGELALHAHHPARLVGHVRRDADEPALVDQGARAGLADPPGRVGREFVAAPPVELLDRAHQADIAFLDEVGERQAAIDVAPRDPGDEAQIGPHHLVLGPLGIAAAALQLGHQGAERGAGSGRPWRGAARSRRRSPPPNRYNGCAAAPSRRPGGAPAPRARPTAPRRRCNC